MSHVISVPVSESAFATLEVEAQESGTPIASVAARMLEQTAAWTKLRRERLAEFDGTTRQQGCKKFEAHFGSIDSGNQNSADNDSIDADLARAYANELADN